MYAENFLRKSLKDSIFQPYSNERRGVNNYGLGFRMKVLTMEKNLRFIMVGGMEAIPLLFIYKKSKVTIIALGKQVF